MAGCKPWCVLRVAWLGASISVCMQGVFAWSRSWYLGDGQRRWFQSNLASTVSFTQACRHHACFNCITCVIWACLDSEMPTAPLHHTRRHQDHAYFNCPIRKAPSGAESSVCGVWLALDEATPDNGCMHILTKKPQLGRPILHFQRRDWQICDDQVTMTHSTRACPAPTHTQHVECSRAPDYITIGFLGRWGTYACPQCLPSDIVPIRSWTRTLRRPGIRHRHLPYHTIPYHTMSQSHDTYTHTHTHTHNPRMNNTACLPSVACRSKVGVCRSRSSQGVRCSSPACFLTARHPTLPPAKGALFSGM